MADTLSWDRHDTAIGQSFASGASLPALAGRKGRLSAGLVCSTLTDRRVSLIGSDQPACKLHDSEKATMSLSFNRASTLTIIICDKIFRMSHMSGTLTRLGYIR